MARFALIGTGAGGRPVPKKLGPPVRQILAASGTTLNSGLRTQRAVNWARKRGAVLSSQRELYDGYRFGRPGYNPANRPGSSTHERRSDGVAYPGPVGRVLRWWQCGLDIGGPYSSRENAERFCGAARQKGWVATITYPSNPAEQHHVNFRKPPILPFILRQGAKGGRVKKYSRRLKFIRSGKTRKSYLPHAPKKKFDGQMAEAVRKFQRDHGLSVDGVIGPNTKAQIDLVFRRQYKRRKKKKQQAKKKARQLAKVRKHPARVPARCVNFVATQEGFRSCPYNDPAGHATIGHGHLLHHGPVTEADRRRWGCITVTESKALLRKDLEATARRVRQLVKVPLNRRQFSAIVSFAYNCGTGALAESTLLKKLNAGNYQAVPAELNRWVNAGGQRLPGLVTRRRKEGRMFRPLKHPNRKLWR